MPRLEYDDLAEPISAEALAMVERAEWQEKDGRRTRITDMSTSHLTRCRDLVAGSDDGWRNELLEPMELELEIRRLGLRGPFMRRTDRP